MNALREEATANCQVLSAAIAGVYKLLETVVDKQSKNTEQTQPQIPMPKTYSEATSPSPPPAWTSPLPPPISKTFPPPQPTRSSPPPPKTEYQTRTRVLYAGDSIGRNVCFPQVEKIAGCSIKTTKAYSSVFDKTARWPKSNFSEIIKKELDHKTYDCLVMSAPTVDISNLDTSNLKQSDNTEGYQQKVMISCQNMFTTAHNALKKHPNLKMIVLMEHAPRNDAKDVDPLRLKPALAKLANNMFNQFWLNSIYKNKINVGNQDGVHLYGPRGKK